MGPIRNPNWSTSGVRVTLSYLGLIMYICVLAFASKTMQEELEDPQAQGQAIQWPKEKGQSLIYKTLHRKLSFPPQRDFYFFGHKKNQ